MEIQDQYKEPIAEFVKKVLEKFEISGVAVRNVDFSSILRVVKQDV